MSATVLPMPQPIHCKVVPAGPAPDSTADDAMVALMRSLWVSSDDLALSRNWLHSTATHPSTTPMRRRCADLLLAYLTATDAVALSGLCELVVIAADDLATMGEMGPDGGEHPSACCGWMDKPYDGHYDKCEQKLAGFRDDALREAMSTLAEQLHRPWNWPLDTVTEAGAR